MASCPPEFDETTSAWSMHRICLEAYLKGHGVTNPGKCRALLVSSLSHVVHILQGHCQSTSVNSLTYKEVVSYLSYLEEYYDPQVNEMAASYAFFSRKQEEEEKVPEFVADLRSLAIKCNFSETFNRMLRDRIICGVRDDQVHRFLLARRKLSLEEVGEFAISFEIASENTQAMRKRDPMDGDGGVHSIQSRHRNRQPARQGTSAVDPRTSCWRCDAHHAADECRHRNSVCHKCAKGHLAKVCKSGRALRQGAYALKDSNDDEESGDEMIQTLVAQSSAKNRDIVRPIEKDLLWEGWKLRMLVDTGSPVILIPENIFKRHCNWWPAFQKTALRKSCFLRPLPVLGRIPMNVQHDQMIAKSVLVVVDCEGPLLSSRKTIQAFNDVGVSLLEVEMPPAPPRVNMLREDAQAHDLL